MKFHQYTQLLAAVSVVASLCFGGGCASTERARVDFSYRVRAETPLEPGTSIAILPAMCTAATDEKWSDLSTTIVASLINDSRSRYQSSVLISERRDARAIFDEADLAAAGLLTRPGGSGGQLAAADLLLLSKVNVETKVEKGKQRTLSGLSLVGGGGRGAGGGGADFRTEEVETVTRHMTVQTEFKLVSAANGAVVKQYSPRTFSQSDRTKASPIFGSSRTVADLTPQDQIICALVERSAQEFVSKIMDTQIVVRLEYESSRNPACIEGARMLRAELWEAALTNFENALAQDPRDHRAAFGAGLACEALGRTDRAVRYYQEACAGSNNDTYKQALDRVRFYGPRAEAVR